MSFFAKNRGRGWFICLCLILLAVALIQSVLYLTCYDSGIGLYRHGFPDGALKLGYLLVACLTVLGFVILPIMRIKKTVSPKLTRTLQPTSSRAVECFALLTAAALAATLITQLINLNAYDPLSILLQTPTQATSTTRTMLIASLIFALPATLPFIGLFAGKKWTYPLLLTLLWTAAYILRVYFDTGVLLMSPTRLMTLAALAAVILFLIAELRLARGIATPMFYGIAATLAALFAGVSGSSALVMTAAGLLPTNTETAYFAFQLAFALYALLRMKAVMAGLFEAYAQSTAVAEEVQTDASSDKETASAPEAQGETL